MYFVYKLMNYRKEVLYVGKTNKLTRRINQHLEKRNKGTAEIADEIKYVEYIVLENELEMSLYEIYYINKYSPLFNTLDNYLEPICDFNIKNKKWINYSDKVNLLDAMNLDMDYLLDNNFYYINNSIYDVLGGFIFSVNEYWSCLDKIKTNNLHLFFNERINNGLFINNEYKKQEKINIYLVGALYDTDFVKMGFSIDDTIERPSSDKNIKYVKQYITSFNKKDFLYITPLLNYLNNDCKNNDVLENEINLMDLSIKIANKYINIINNEVNYIKLKYNFFSNINNYISSNDNLKCNNSLNETIKNNLLYSKYRNYLKKIMSKKMNFFNSTQDIVASFFNKEIYYFNFCLNNEELEYISKIEQEHNVIIIYCIKELNDKDLIYHLIYIENNITEINEFINYIKKINNNINLNYLSFDINSKTLNKNTNSFKILEEGLVFDKLFK